MQMEMSSLRSKKCKKSGTTGMNFHGNIFYVNRVWNDKKIAAFP